eukprot:6175039-Pleurochrysis_carterae.AAC.3
METCRALLTALSTTMCTRACGGRLRHSYARPRKSLLHACTPASFMRLRRRDEALTRRDTVCCRISFALCGIPNCPHA